MIEQAALTVASTAVVAAAIFAILRWDRQLGSFGHRYSLRTLLILSAVLPPAVAGGYSTLQQFTRVRPAAHNLRAASQRAASRKLMQARLRMYRDALPPTHPDESAMNDALLIPVFVPALVVLLTRSEKRKGSPLTGDEVIAIRDQGVCVMLKRSLAHKMWKMRGYDDIDPENAWDEWQAARQTLVPDKTTN